MKGLDDRSRNEDGRIREKRGDTKISNLIPEYPELKVFSNTATLGGVKQRYRVQSLDQVRKVALIKERANRLNQQQS